MVRNVVSVRAQELYRNLRAARWSSSRNAVSLAVWILLCASGLLMVSSGGLSAQDLAARESKHYEIVTLPIPTGIVMEAGAIEMMPGGRMAVSTRLGDIYMVDGAFENPPKNVKYTLFASGLHEVLGLAWREGWLYATQRGEVTRIQDVDGDGRGDIFQTYSQGWGITGDYHEYAFGSKFDRDGNMWVVLCLTGSFTSDTEFRGWACGSDRMARRFQCVVAFVLQVGSDQTPKGSFFTRTTKAHGTERAR